MAVHKYIYWRPDMSEEGSELQFANVHLLIGYNPRTIADYQKMAAVLRETFPEANDDELHCENVSKSSLYQGFTLLTWTAKIARKPYEGWLETTLSPEYSW